MKSETVWADPAEVRAWAEEMPWEYLECRKRGWHQLDYYRAFYDKDIKAFREILLCWTCEAVTQENIISADDGSYIEHGSLKYVDKEYLREKGSGRIDAKGKDVIRLMVIQHRSQSTSPRRLKSVS
jgi:hypothetical protein